MKKTGIIVAVIVLIVALAVYFFVINKKNGTFEDAIEQVSIKKAWVEVLSGDLFLANDSENMIVLRSGDEINQGDILETDEHGLVNINFFDGSVARMDSSTKLIIDNALFSSEDGVVFKSKIVIGNLWSKIVKLTTPESVWEVNTANAVAAVRGTAFGVSFTGTSTIILGMENQVLVQVVNPFDNKIIENQEILILPNQRIIIPMEMMGLFLNGEKNMKDLVEEVDDSFFQEKWIIVDEQYEHSKDETQIEDGSGELDNNANRRSYNSDNTEEGNTSINETGDANEAYDSQTDNTNSTTSEPYESGGSGNTGEEVVDYGDGVNDYLGDYPDNQNPDQTDETYDATYNETGDPNDNQTTSSTDYDFQYQPLTYPNFNLLQ